MTVESASYISQLNTSLPASTDPKSEGPAHFQLIKSVLKTQFPNFGTAAMTASHTELNYIVGVTSAVQTQLNARSLRDGDIYAGAHDFTGASSVTGPTPTTGDSSTKLATTAFVAATAFTSALPGQTGNNGKLLTTDGASASWTDTINTAKTFAADITLSGNARRIKGDLSSFTRSDRLTFTNSGSSGEAAVSVCPSTSFGTGGAWYAYGKDDIDNSSFVSVYCNRLSSRAGLDSSKTGTDAALPLFFSIGGTAALQIHETSLHVRSVGGGGIGYGVGSGGTVTQLTSKSTGVTLNKPSGQITTHNASLAANTDVSFVLTNSVVEVGDAVYVTGSSAANYLYRTGLAASGGVTVFIRNTTAGSLSDALTIDFKVIKGALT